MITIEIVCARFAALRPDELRRWIEEGYVRPEPADGGPVFQDIDIERVRLILELRDGLAVNDEALPLVLSLLDQVYALRRQLRGLGVADDDG